MSLTKVLQGFSATNFVSWIGCSILLYLSFLTTRSWQSVQSFHELSASTLDTISFWLTLVTTPQASFDVLSISVLFTFSVLASFQVVLWFKLYRRQKQSGRCLLEKNNRTLSLLGGLAAIIGIGCAACGAALLVSFLSWFGLSGLILAFPLHGLEVGIFGVVLLTYTSYRLVLAW